MSKMEEEFKGEAKDVYLVVEDSKIYRTLISNVFRENNLRVLECADGKVAAKALKSKRYNVKGVFSDIAMPVMSGLDLLYEIRDIKKYKDLPVVLVTSTPDKESVLVAKKLGVIAYMIKPIAAKQVLEKVQLMSMPDKNYGRPTK